MKLSLAGAKHLPTTIAGVIIIGGATFALFKGQCSYDQWQTVVLAAIALLGGAGLILATPKKKEEGE